MLQINKNKLYQYSLVFVLIRGIFSQDFNIARIHYSGGGDWYADPSSLPNLISFVSAETNIQIEPIEHRMVYSSVARFETRRIYKNGR